MNAKNKNSVVAKMIKMMLVAVVAVGSLSLATGCDEDGYYYGTGQGNRFGQLNQSNEIPLDPADVESWFNGFSGWGTGSSGGSGHSH